MKLSTIFLLVLLAARAAFAESFCTCATDGGTATGEYKNAECEALGVPKAAGSTVRCVDFEDARWTLASGAGSLTDPTEPGSCPVPEQVSLRGNGGVVFETFGTAGWGFGIGSWNHGTPASPTYGAACDDTSDGGSHPCGPCNWAHLLTGDTLQTAGNGTVCTGTFRAGDAAEFFNGSAEPAQPLAGSNSFAMIVPVGSTCGLASGSSALAFDADTYSVSVLKAYPSNVYDSNVMANPWKGDQCGDNAHCVDTWLGLDSGATQDQFPFVGTSIYSLDDCAGARTGATYEVGSVSSTDCNGANYRIVSPTNYTRSVDWPYGTAGLVQTVYEAMDTAASKITIYFTPLGGSRKTLFRVTNLDTRGVEGPSPFRINAYSNANQEGGSGTDERTGRVMDNLLVQSWPTGSRPADATALLLTPSQMQLSAAPSPSPSPSYCCRQ